MSEFRTEKDSMGEIRVLSGSLWGAQTQRSLENFKISTELMPPEVICGLVIVKKSAAKANFDLGKLSKEKAEKIIQACDEILEGKHNEAFPLKVWQTGSGTQSNMNVNEVIANLASKSHDSTPLHPNDDVNMSQSSNDVFPAAMHIAAYLSVKTSLLPAIEKLTACFKRLEKENEGVVKSGRTHLQDAVPISFSQEISGWRAMLENNCEQLEDSLKYLSRLAVGATAVGTGINAPENFDSLCAEYISRETGFYFEPDYNKFHSLASKDAMVFAHGAVRALAANMMKIANDIRWLASGPRNGLSEISIPANEPGSSIMPGKVNPTQCEAVTMCAVQVMGNDCAIGIAASQGNFELNVFMPVIIYDFLQSVRLMSDSIISFTENCVSGIKADREKMSSNLHNSLMLVTAIAPYIGYDNAAKVAKKAFEDNSNLKTACIKLGFMSKEEFDRVFKPEEMV